MISQVVTKWNDIRSSSFGDFPKTNSFKRLPILFRSSALSLNSIFRNFMITTVFLSSKTQRRIRPRTDSLKIFIFATISSFNWRKKKAKLKTFENKECMPALCHATGWVGWGGVSAWKFTSYRQTDTIVSRQVALLVETARLKSIAFVLFFFTCNMNNISIGKTCFFF